MALRDKLRKKAQELKSKARSDIQAADRKISNPEAQAKAKAAAIKQAKKRAKALSEPDLEDAERDKSKVSDRAFESGEARAPMDADLNMTGDPRGMEAFATAGVNLDDQGSESMEDLVLGSGPMATSDDAEVDESEDFGIGVGFGDAGDDDDSAGWFDSDGDTEGWF